MRPSASTTTIAVAIAASTASMGGGSVDTFEGIYPGDPAGQLRPRW
jgi:hypothetical protein